MSATPETSHELGAATGTVVIRNPSAVDGGTAFRPTNGRSYFDGLR